MIAKAENTRITGEYKLISWIIRQSKGANELEIPKFELSCCQLRYTSLRHPTSSMVFSLHFGGLYMTALNPG